MQNTRNPARGRWFFSGGLVLVWAGLAGAGLALMARQSKLPGPAAAIAEQAVEMKWPGLATDRPTLLMFLHPHCPCSRASVEELARAMTLCQNRIDARVIFFKPPGEPDQWARTDLWESAQAIPGVSVACDSETALLERFGVFTSGQVLLYGSAGQLLFSGGITGARGHAGDNAGLTAVVSLVRPGGATPAGVVRTNVYGCQIAPGELPVQSREPRR